MFRQPRLLTMLVLAFALALRVTVPAGWMPSATGGAFAIELCAAAAPAVHAGGHEKSTHHGSQEKGEHSGDCAFAPFQTGFASAPQQAPVINPALPALAVPQHAARPFFATGPPAPPPPATGPPAIA